MVVLISFPVKGVSLEDLRFGTMLLLGNYPRVIILGGGTCQNFDRDARPPLLGLIFGQILFFWVG